MGSIRNAKAEDGKQRAMEIRAEERASGEGTRPTQVLREDVPKSQVWSIRAHAHMGGPA